MPDREEPKSGGPGPSAGGRSGKTVPLRRGSSFNMELTGLLRESLRPVLIVVSGKETGRRIVLPGTSVIGRDPDADVVLDDEGISWHHARIEDRGDSWAIVDLGSMNGTIVRGKPVESAALADGDPLMIGDSLLRVELRSAVERALGEELQKVIDLDDLSGLYVRRKFDELVVASLRKAGLRGQPVGMIVMDMDGIKQINDTHGHLFGAYVIGETGRVIGEVIGSRGIGCRFGGDEFIATLPGLDRDATLKVAEEIHAAVNSWHYERNGIVLTPGICLGVGAYPADGKDATSLFEHADRAMYRAKEGGRNRVSL